MEPITISGQVTFDDYLKAQLFHHRKRAYILGFFILAISIFLISWGREYIFSSFFIVYVLFLRPLFVRWSLKKKWRKTPSAIARDYWYEFDDDGVYSKDDTGAKITTYWNKFLKFSESKDSFLLYLGPYLFVFLPKRLMAKEMRTELLNLFSKKIPKKA